MSESLSSPFHSAQLMPITKMGERRNALEIYAKLPGRNFCMQNQDGQKKYPLIFGLMPYDMRMTYATVFQIKRTAALHWNVSSVNVSSNLTDFHTFGCPVYTLNARLATGSGTLSPWQSRSQLGLNLGPSPRHARNCHLVLNINTGTVSPQYHVTFDEFFETVRDRAEHSNHTSEWMRRAGFGEVAMTPSEQISPTPQTPTPVTPESLPVQREEPNNTNQNTIQDDNVSEPNHLLPNEFTESQNIIQEPQEYNGQEHAPIAAAPTEDNEQAHSPNVQTTTNTPTLRRSTRVRKPSRRLQESIEAGTYDVFESLQAEAMDPNKYYDALHQDDYKLQDDLKEPLSFLSKTQNDTMYFHQAMKEPDREEFVKAMVKEYNDHTDRKHWELITKDQVPEGTKILDSIWSMKRKRDIITREVYKWKARLNIHGGQQEYGVVNPSGLNHKSRTPVKLPIKE